MILQQIAIRVRLIILSPHRSRVYYVQYTDICYVCIICNELNIYDHNSHGKFIDIKTVFAKAIASHFMASSPHSQPWVRHAHKQVKQLYRMIFLLNLVMRARTDSNTSQFKLTKFRNFTLTGTKQCVCMNSLIDLPWPGIGCQSQIFQYRIHRILKCIHCAQFVRVF